MEKAAGFCGLDVLTDVSDPCVFLLVTRWTDEGSFQAWHRSAAHHHSHELIPQGLKLDAAFTSLTIGNSIEDPAGIQRLGDALEGRTVALSQWLMESDVVFALLLSPDGTIRSRNRAADRIFRPDPAKDFGSTIWDFLAGAGSERLRQQLSDSGPIPGGCQLLNLVDLQGNAVTVEIGLIRCGGTILLLGTHEQRHDSQFQTEILELTNDLSVMMRESARKNRELEQANETIARLARTDLLTGLANRRTLHEALQREIARAERLGEPLSVIIADLDHFKLINDRYGHLTGDLVLARAAAVFGSQSRPYDLAARYGGEEFVLLLPATSTADAVVIAERVRRGVAELDVPECPTEITVSLGVATWVTGEGAEAFVGHADAALYRAKNAGRNRVEAASIVRG